MKRYDLRDLKADFIPRMVELMNSDVKDGESLPELEISINESVVGKTAIEICRNLRNGNPPIYVYHGLLYKGKLVVSPLHLDDKSAKIVGDRIRKEVISN